MSSESMTMAFRALKFTTGTVSVCYLLFIVSPLMIESEGFWAFAVAAALQALAGGLAVMAKSTIGTFNQLLLLVSWLALVLPHVSRTSNTILGILLAASTVAYVTSWVRTRLISTQGEN